MLKVGIWNYAQKLEPLVQDNFRLSLGEGNTPLEENKNLAEFLDLEKIYFKREDKNPTGSHKDRGLSYEISAHVQDGQKDFVISSSGNSAISAINLLKGRDEKLHIFLSSNLSITKINRLVKFLPNISENIFTGKDVTFENFNFYFTQRPLSSAFYFAKTNNCILLRGSTDIYGYEGFKTISYELKKQAPDADAIFIPTSSGTTAKGIYEGFKDVDINIPLHLIQTSKINTLVHRFDNDYQPNTHSLADSIVDRIGHRVKEVEELILNTKGSGWIIGDKQINEAQRLLKSELIETSNESALNIAAIKKAKEKGCAFKRPICLFTGTN